MFLAPLVLVLLLFSLHRLSDWARKVTVVEHHTICRSLAHCTPCRFCCVVEPLLVGEEGSLLPGRGEVRVRGRLHCDGSLQDVAKSYLCHGLSALSVAALKGLSRTLIPRQHC